MEIYIYKSVIAVPPPKKNYLIGLPQAGPTGNPLKSRANFY